MQFGIKQYNNYNILLYIYQNILNKYKINKKNYKTNNNRINQNILIQIIL